MLTNGMGFLIYNASSLLRSAASSRNCAAGLTYCAFFQDIHPVGKGQRKIDALLRKQDREALALESCTCSSRFATITRANPAEGSSSSSSSGLPISVRATHAVPELAELRLETVSARVVVRISHGHAKKVAVRRTDWQWTGQHLRAHELPGSLQIAHHAKNVIAPCLG
jgi:hypothetical protein